MICAYTMRYRVKQTDLTPVAGGEVALTANTGLMRIDAPNAIEAVREFIRRNGLQVIGEIEEGTGGSANASCKDAGRAVVVRAFPDPDEH